MKNSFEIKGSTAFYRHELRIKENKIKHLQAEKIQLDEEFTAVNEEFESIIKRDEEKITRALEFGQNNMFSEKENIFINTVRLKKHTAVYNSRIKQINTEIELEINCLGSLKTLVDDLEFLSKESERYYGR
jgi:hypothetical protein